MGQPKVALNGAKHARCYDALGRKLTTIQRRAAKRAARRARGK